MFIREIRIQNFGQYSQRRFHFRSEFQLIFGANESGKTTLQQFVLAMFYGFPTRGRSLERNQRLRYLPWQGAGSMGGSIYFTHAGQDYILQRQFGSSKSKDKTELLLAKSGRHLSLNEAAEPGREILGLSYGEFCNSSFMAQIETDVGADDSVEQKLNHILSAGDETFSYDRVQKELKAQARQLQSGESPLALPNLLRQRTSLEADLSAALLRDKQTEVKQRQIERCRQQLKQIETKQTKNLLQEEEAVRLTDSKLAKLPSLKELADLDLYWQRLSKLREQTRLKQALLTEQSREEQSWIQKNDLRLQHIAQERQQLKLSQRKEAEKAKLPPEKTPWQHLSLILAGESLLFMFAIWAKLKAPWLVLIPIFLALVIPVFLFVVQSNNTKRRQAILKEILEQQRRAELQDIRSENQLKQLEWEERSLHEQAHKLKQKIGQTEQELTATMSLQTRQERQFWHELRPYFQDFPAETDVGQWYLELRDRSISQEADTAKEQHIAALKQELRQGQIEAELAVLNNDLLHLSANQKDTASIEAALKEVVRREEEQNLRLKSIELALFLTERSREQFEQQGRPRLNELCSRYMKQLSNKRYGEVKIAPSWEMLLATPQEGQFQAEAYYSSGTRELLWLSLRLALRDFLAQAGEAPPLLIDDVLRQVDSARLDSVLRLCLEVAQQGRGQIIYFTSSQELRERAVKHGISIIDLDRLA